jgi:hypothetical protein
VADKLQSRCCNWGKPQSVNQSAIADDWSIPILRPMKTVGAGHPMALKIKAGQLMRSDHIESDRAANDPRDAYCKSDRTEHLEVA